MNPKVKEKKEALTDIKIFNVEGLPSMEVLKEDDAFPGDNFLKILGTKSNQIIRSIKEYSSSLYRKAWREFEKKMINESGSGKFSYTEEAFLVFFFQSAFARSALLEEHRNLIANNQPHKAEKLPIIEYSLLENWNNQFKHLKRGLWGKTHKGSVIQTLGNGDVLPEGAWLPSIMASYRVGRSSAIDMAWVDWATEDAVSELVNWHELNDKQRGALAGAIFALASIIESRDLLIICLEVEPDLGRYLAGVTIRCDNLAFILGARWKTVFGIDSSAIKQFGRYTEVSRMLVSYMFNSQDMSLLHKSRSTIDSIIDDMESRVSMELQSALDDSKPIIQSISDLESKLPKIGEDLSCEVFFSFINGWRTRIQKGIELLNSAPLSLVSQCRVSERHCVQVFAETSTEVSERIDTLSAMFESLIKDKSSLEETFKDLSWQEQFAEMERIKIAVDEFCNLFVKLSYLDDLAQPVELMVIPENYEDPVGVLDKKEVDDLQLKVDSLTDELAVANDRVHELEALMSSADHEINSLTKTNLELSLKVESLSHGFSKLPGQIEPESFKPVVEAFLYDSGSKVEQVMRFIETLHSDKIRFLPNAYKTAEKFSDSLPASALYQRLDALANGVKLMRNGGRLIDLRDVVPGNVSALESETVRLSESLRGQRTFADGAKKRIMYPHFSVDYAHRVYFDYDHEEERILVGYIGGHMPSAKHTTI